MEHMNHIATLSGGSGCLYVLHQHPVDAAHARSPVTPCIRPFLNNMYPSSQQTSFHAIKNRRERAATTFRSGKE